MLIRQAFSATGGIIDVRHQAFVYFHKSIEAERYEAHREYRGTASRLVPRPPFSGVRGRQAALPEDHSELE